MHKQMIVIDLVIPVAIPREDWEKKTWNYWDALRTARVRIDNMPIRWPRGLYRAIRLDTVLRMRSDQTTLST